MQPEQTPMSKFFTRARSAMASASSPMADVCWGSSHAAQPSPKRKDAPTRRWTRSIGRRDIAAAISAGVQSAPMSLAHDPEKSATFRDHALRFPPGDQAIAAQLFLGVAHGQFEDKLCGLRPFGKKDPDDDPRLAVSLARFDGDVERDRGRSLIFRWIGPHLKIAFVGAMRTNRRHQPGRARLHP